MSELKPAPKSVIAKYKDMQEDGININEKARLVKLYPGKEFKDRFNGLIAGQVYIYRKEFSFRAGSYSGYNAWRNQLAKLGGYKPIGNEERYGKVLPAYDRGAWAARSGPFWELINFYDNEGVIGPDVSKKLLKDFRRFRQQAMKHHDKWFYESYQEWEKALAMASKNGAIIFH